MGKTVDFFFDVGSPYSYLAFHELQRVAARQGATIAWRPMLLGGVFKATGNRSPMDVPAKRDWVMKDLLRWTARLDVPMRHNPYFPINTLALMRGITGIQMRHPEQFASLTRSILSGMWEQALNLGESAEVGALLRGAGFDPAEFEALTNDAAVKDQLKRNTEEAVERGVFGAPTFFVRDEMFWGVDRLQFVEAALAAS